ncbi:uncharacterized protein MELLADRAFT_111884 [Melampsora larici-populina 98AG31]|uniref:Uncharacterized protein n=1 Tax=Melampsora larici-populina (strain 98AG31 / pathotype 3-4-7) TaxID=747676 RepID=F4S4P3_MELLP|nr:uncharacterized protein MELLADRAFT_111884 [Melampsora larici-populina 98AG31]EGG00323.1 hypothetical protein MELLADRAFT_111884 [Melampsora larici-populina 98AG31]
MTSEVSLRKVSVQKKLFVMHTFVVVQHRSMNVGKAKALTIITLQAKEKDIKGAQASTEIEVLKPPCDYTVEIWEVEVVLVWDFSSAFEKLINNSLVLDNNLRFSKVAYKGSNKTWYQMNKRKRQKMAIVIESGIARLASFYFPSLGTLHGILYNTVYINLTESI